MQPISMRSSITRSALVGAATLVLSACVFTPADEPRSHGFYNALQLCRLQQSGRANRRVHLPPTHPGVAACLERRGWTPDGVPAPSREATNEAVPDAPRNGVRL